MTTSTQRADARPADGGFLPPPSLTGAATLPGGGVRLTGRAPPDALVRLLAPDGRALGVTTDATGAWRVDLESAADPRMFALTAEAGGRTLRAEGALAVGPPGAATRALVARAGAPSAPAEVAGEGGVRLAAVDFDAGGGLAASGAAPAGAALRLVVDGAAVGTGQADKAGRFGVLSVGAALPPGAHTVRVEDGRAAAETTVDTAPAAPLSAAPFRVARTVGGWRLDWSTPGGGVQSLVLREGAR